MKKIKLSKKMKFLMGISGLAIIGVTLPVSLLTSCSSAANPYGPYSIINADSITTGNSTGKQNSQMPAIKYDTKRQEYYVFNANHSIIKDQNYGNYDKLNNSWISSGDVLNYYNWLANQQVKKVLSNDDSNKDNRKSILEKYYYTADSNGSTKDESLLDNAVNNYNFENLNFVYGVAPTEDMQNIAKLYNQMTIEGNVFKLASALATELISYGITSEFAGMYNWLANGTPAGTDNPLSINSSTSSSPSVSTRASDVELQNLPGNVTSQAEQKQEAQKFANESVMQWGQKIVGTTNNNDKSNANVAKEFTFGVGTIVGEGSNTYHLWPSGFNAKFEYYKVNYTTTPSESTNNQQNEGTPGINNPYPINPGQNGPIQYRLKVSDITINYQWYRAKKTGGEYENAQNVSDYMSGGQKESLAKINGGDGVIHNSAYKLPISSLEFNVTPMTSSYVDPIQNGLLDYVYNGIWTVQPRLINTNEKEINWSINVPTNMLSKATSNGDATARNNTTSNATQIGGVAWQSFRNYTKNTFNKQEMINNKNLLPSTAEQIATSLNGENNNLLKAQFYQTNAQAWSANTQYESAFQVLTNSSNNANSTLLNFYQTKYLMSLFNNVYGSAGLKPSDRPVYNNFNNLNKYIFLKMWELGWMTENVSKTTEAKEYVKNDSWLNDGHTSKINQVNPEGTKDYDAVISMLKNKGSLNVLLKTEEGKKYATTAKKGIDAFYNIVDPSKIQSGVIYEINNETGVVTTKSANNAKSSNEPNTEVVVNDNKKK